jgi:hypothetical protein
MQYPLLAKHTLALLEMAISKGVDTEQLSKLMDLHERWEDRQSKKAY